MSSQAQHTGRILCQFWPGAGIARLDDPPTLGLVIGPLCVSLDLSLKSVWWLPRAKVEWPAWGVGWLLAAVTWRQLSD